MNGPIATIAPQIKDDIYEGPVEVVYDLPPNLVDSRTRVTEGGLRFDSFTNDPRVNAVRATALDRMYGVLTRPVDGVVATAPQVPPHVSYEYWSSMLVAKVEDPAIKAEIGRIWIAEMVAEGRFVEATEALTKYGLDNVDLGDMQSLKFVGFLYNQAVITGDHFGASRIADFVARLKSRNEANKIFKAGTDQADVRYENGWEARKDTSFEKYSAEVLGMSASVEGFDFKTFSEVQFAYNAWQLRAEDGFYAENIHPLATRVAQEYCRLLVLSGNHAAAYRVALEANLPYGDVIKLEDSIPGIEGIKTRMASRLKRMFGTNSKPRKPQ